MTSEDEEKFTNFMKSRQKELGHPLNIFDFLKAKCDYFISLGKVNDTISEYEFKRGRYIAELCYKSIMQDLKDFGITEKDGFLLDYFKNDK